MPLALEGRRAVVTGASAGLGREIARQLGAAGAHVVLVARRRDELEALARQMAAEGTDEPTVVVDDLADPDAPARIHDAVTARIGGADILVNNAGQADPAGALLDEAAWRTSFELNFHAKRRLAELFGPTMAVGGYGRVVNLVGLLEPFTVTAAQAAVAACTLWAKAYSRQVAPEGITVNGIAPGRIDSEQVRRHFDTPEKRREFIDAHIPAGRFGTPAEIAALAVFLCSPAAAYITGETISVDGGMHRSI